MLNENYQQKWKEFLEALKKNDKRLTKNFIVEYNPHSIYFDSIEDAIESYDFPNEEIKQKCIQEDQVWILQFHRNSVGFISLAHYNFYELIKWFLDTLYIVDNEFYFGKEEL